MSDTVIKVENLSKLHRPGKLWFKNDRNTIMILEDIGLRNIIISSVTVMEILQGAINKNNFLM